MVSAQSSECQSEEIQPNAGKRVTVTLSLRKSYEIVDGKGLRHETEISAVNRWVTNETLSLIGGDCIGEIACRGGSFTRDCVLLGDFPGGNCIM